MERKRKNSSLTDTERNILLCLLQKYKCFDFVNFRNERKCSKGNETTIQGS